MVDPSADRLEEKAIKANPQKYNARNPWSKVDQWVRENAVVELQPSQDFRPASAAKRDLAIKLDVRDTVKELRSKAARTTQEQQKFISAADDPLSPEFYNPAGTENQDYFVNNYAEQAEELLALEGKRLTGRDISKYKATADIIRSAAAQGIDLNDDDIENLVDWGIVNSATDKMLAAYNAGDEIALRNVMLTLRQNSPEMASLAPEILMDKIVESFEDPTIIENMSTGIMNALGVAMTPFVIANEYVMQGIRSAGEASAQMGSLNPALRLPGMAKAFFDPEDRERVAPGVFDQSYMSEIINSGKYTPLQIEIATEISRRAALGDPEAIMSTYTDRYLGVPEAAKIIADLSYNRANPQMQELMRQVDSAHLGNTGQVIFGAALDVDEFDPARGGELRQDLANIAGVTASFVFDPTLFGAKIYRTAQASKWMLTSLAPGAGPASRVIKQMRLGKLTINSAPYRLFDQFTKDLNKIEELETAAKAAKGSERTRLAGEAAAARNRMTRQYADMPEDLIEDFRTTMPRNADGKFDVETAIRYIDDTNEAIETAAGRVSEELAAVGATADVQRAAVQKILDEKTFYGRVSSTNQKRVPLVPGMSPVAMLRKKAVNSIGAALMPYGKSVKIVDEYINDATNALDFAEGLSARADEFGTAARREKSRTLGGVADSFNRMFSSIVTKGYISVSTADDAKEVYRYARTFHSRRTSEMIADAYRKGDAGSRRLLLSGLIRSAAASRGITITKAETDNWIRGIIPGGENLATGTRTGERYGLQITGSKLPSERFQDVRSGVVPEVIEDEIDSVVTRSLSADSNGIEHALHLDQTADNIALPNLKEFEDLRSQISLGIIPVGKARNTLGATAQKATDYWSIGTLFGFRFSLRNAIEETGMYWLTGGSVANWYKGRKASQATRKVRPRIYVKTVRDGLGKRAPVYKDGVPQLVYKSSLGMFANKAEWFKRQLTKSEKVDDYFTEWQTHNGFRNWMADLILPATRYDDSLVAMQEFAAGNPEAFAELAVKALAAQKRGLNLNAMTPEDEAAYGFLVNSTHGMALLDEIAEAAPYLNSGGFPMFLEGTRGFLDDIPPGVGFGKAGDYSARLGGYSNVPPIQMSKETGSKIYGASFWWRELQRTLDGDGAMGQVAVEAIAKLSKGQITASEAKALVAKAIREDDTYDYVGRLSRIKNDASIEEFADAYFENTLQHFMRADYTINDELVDMFVSKSDGKFLGFWEDLGDGTATPRVSKDRLLKFDRKDRPEYVFGREVDETPWIPVAETLPALLSVDRAYGWMGAQNARISREPIFLANYFDQYAQTRDVRGKMAEAMARSRGREVTDMDRMIADTFYARSSMDNAYTLSLSYIDNPANRSNLAWKARNVSRYYRASEDFYRRMKRVATNSPESFWKGALVYQLLDDTGFTFEDDNGDKYFAYPGNELMQSAVASVASRYFGVDMKDFQNIDPFFIGGKVLGVAPSTDPNQLAPSFMGPVSGVVLASLFNAFPTLQGLRSATMGQYSQPTGSWTQDVLNTVLPAGVTRVMRIIDPDQLDSQLSQAAIDTVALMVATGQMDKLTVTVDGKTRVIDGAKVTPTEFKATDQWKASQSIAWGVFVTKLVFSTFGAAAPQTYSNTASEQARSLGVDSMEDFYRDYRDVLFKPEFLEYVEARVDEPNPFAAALADFYAMNTGKVIDGEYASMESFLPFTLSTYKTPDDSPIKSLSQIQISKELVDWTETEEAKSLARNGFEDVRYFLAPRAGEFDWDAWTIGKNVLGLKVKKTVDEQLEELFAMKGKQNDNTIRREYNVKIANARTADEAARYREEQEGLREYNRSVNPAWDRVTGSSTGVYTEANFRLAFDRMREMLAFIEERDGKLTGDALQINNAIDIYLEYKNKASGFVGQKKAIKAERQRIEAEMQQMFAQVKSESPNAQFFIETILDEVSYNEAFGDIFGDD